MAMDLNNITTYQAVTMLNVLGRGNKRIMTDFLQKWDITLNEWLLLGTVVDGGSKGVRNTEIAKNLNVEMPVVTKLVKKCQDEGMFEVDSDKKDGRAKKVKATKKAADTVRQIEAELQEGMKEWFAGVSPEKIMNYLEVLHFQAEKARQV